MNPSSSHNGKPFAWEALIPRLVHPLKVTIIEALSWIDLPLSAKELDRLLDEEFGVSLVSYHVRRLAGVGAIEMVEQRPVRGALQTFYVLAELEPVGPNLCHE